ncbi:MAG: hypothetical protein HY913_02815 [Desulfomonile tiedjei]|nr:hypothetical protein [Desulfomonile tiedjei]
MSGTHLAHTANQFNKVDCLRDHLTNVANRAAAFAAVFDASAETSNET